MFSFNTHFGPKYLSNHAIQRSFSCQIFLELLTQLIRSFVERFIIFFSRHKIRLFQSTGTTYIILNPFQPICVPIFVAAFYVYIIFIYQ